MTTVGETYELLEELGRGGFGAVHRARHRLMNREVALKVLHATTERERFLREAQILAQLDHPNIVRVFDVGVDASNGSAYIAMELLEGASLFDEVRLRGALPLEEATFVALGVLDALGAVHAAGVIHRDLKPANVFLAQTSRGVVPKLLDFGVSRITSRETRLTKEGSIVGTMRYMAPEVLLGEEATPSADVWSAAIVFLETLLGRHAYDARGEALVRAILDGPPPALRELVAPRAVIDALSSALAPRQRRFASATAFRNALTATAPARAPAKTSVAMRAIGDLGDLGAAFGAAPGADGPAQATAPVPASAQASAPKHASAQASAPKHAQASAPKPAQASAPAPKPAQASAPAPKPARASAPAPKPAPAAAPPRTSTPTPTSRNALIIVLVGLALALVGGGTAFVVLETRAPSSAENGQRAERATTAPVVAAAPTVPTLVPAPVDPVPTPTGVAGELMLPSAATARRDAGATPAAATPEQGSTLGGVAPTAEATPEAQSGAPTAHGSSADTRRRTGSDSTTMSSTTPDDVPDEVQILSQFQTRRGFELLSCESTSTMTTRAQIRRLESTLSEPLASLTACMRFNETLVFEHRGFITGVDRAAMGPNATCIATRVERAIHRLNVSGNGTISCRVRPKR